MKKRIALTGSILAISLLATSVTGARPVEVHDDTDFSNFTTVVTSDVFDFDTTFDVLPEGYNYYDTEHKATIDRLYYTTDAYEDGVTYQKYATVYVPYGYDPADTETKYNVLYFIHGNGSSPNALWDSNNRNINTKFLMDNMFDPDHQVMDPCIVISATYYFEADENTYHTEPADGPAGDGRYDGIPGNFYREVVEDLIPQIESQYNVYCEDFSEEGIIASRAHRALSGYSRGSMCTWYLLHHDFEYFGYYMPMSANIGREGKPIGEEGSHFTEEEAFDYINEAIQAHPELDFFIYATCGGEKDQAGRNMIPQMQYFYSQDDVISYGTDPAVNNFYFTCSDFKHADLYMPYILYNGRDILFH